ALVRDAPHTAPVKRYRSSGPVSLRDAHCTGSFTIERGTLIRSSSSCSSSVGGGVTGSNGVRSGGAGSAGKGKGAGSSCRNENKNAGAGEASSRGASCQVRSRGKSIEEEPLSPPKPELSPGPPALAMSR
ncbi:unnamed protein product, partial [Ectocarpus sp. 13 AM-2016]